MKETILKLLPVVAPFFIGFLTAYYIQSLKVDTLNEQLKSVTNELQIERDTVAICRKSVETQNLAIVNLQDKKAEAEALMGELQVERDSAEKIAQDILRRRPSPSENVCEHARNEFANELARERSSE